MGLEKAVSRLVDYEQSPEDGSKPDWAKPDPERSERLRASRQAGGEDLRRARQEEARIQRERMVELRGWWLTRMASGRRPLQEKMVLFWHGHFATSVVKVRDAYLMWRQNDLFRSHAMGPWGGLLQAVSTDPAMLIWLDQAQSREEHPNENYARELMELFTLGEGHYSERDVSEAARALTGISLGRGREEYMWRPRLHDAGMKTFLGRSGPLGLQEVIAQILVQPQAARFITAKLWSFFAQQSPSEEWINTLAAEFRSCNMQFRPWLREVFCSEAFYAPGVVRTQVKSPVQLLITAVRQLERGLPSPLAAANAVRLLGQDLFAPPNVKGWDGGLAWMTTNNLLNRHNLAAWLVLGQGILPPAGGRFAGRGLMNAANRLPGPVPVETSKLFSADQCANAEAVVGAMERRFLQAKLSSASLGVIRDYLAARPKMDDHTLLPAVRLFMCTPEYQLI